MIRRAKPIARRSKPGKRTSKRRKVRKARQQDCDRLFAELVKDRDDWTCKACGSIRVPQCAHIVSRRYRATRWSLDNAVCLCARDHMRWTYDPLGWEAWVEERFPGRLDSLKARALAGVAWVDYEAIKAGLEIQRHELLLRRRKVSA